MSDFKFNLEEDGRFYIIKLFGSLATNEISEVREVFDKMIELYKFRDRFNLNFIVDYAEVTEVDSATIGNILDRLDFMVNNNHKMSFINVSEHFTSLVEIHHMEDQIKCYSSEEEARAQMMKEDVE